MGLGLIGVGVLAPAVGFLGGTGRVAAPGVPSPIPALDLPLWISGMVAGLVLHGTAHDGPGHLKKATPDDLG